MRKVTLLFIYIMLICTFLFSQAYGPKLPDPPTPEPINLFGSLRFQWPMENYKITSMDGYRDDVHIPGQIGGGDSIHFGVDMIPASGSAKRVPIHAVEDGEVTISYPAPGTPIAGTKRTFKGHAVYGGCVQIRHLLGTYKNKPIYVYTFYAHMKEVWVSEIDGKNKVKKGQVIGIMGGTGKVTGSHLHFDITYNPMDLLILSGMLSEEPSLLLIK